MLQRKGIPRSFSNASYFHGSGAILPTTSNGSTRNSSPGPRRRSTYNSVAHCCDGAIGSISLLSVGKVISIGAILFVAATILRKVAFDGSPATEDLFDSSAEVELGGAGLHSAYWSILDEQNLPLSEFPSIQYALDHSDIVLLYFAASWCPMSTPITQLLDEKFGDILLPPPDETASKTKNLKVLQNTLNKQRRPISLVYVSSDETEAQMKEYARRHWITIPFATDERANLKKHFKVAAKREMGLLEMESRLYEIPSIIIVSGESHNVVTTHGVQELKEKGSEALIHWIKLLHTVKALEDKYY